MMTDIGNRCVECDKDTSFGSGRFVNRVPASRDDVEGYLCPDCNQVECDRCDEMIGVDEDVTPWSLELQENEFKDGATCVHYDCLTKEEKGVDKN